MALIRDGLLALTTLDPVYGLQLRAELAARTGRIVNAGQIYTTLERLERDGLIAVTGKTTDGLDLVNATPAGRVESDIWFANPEASWDGLVFQTLLGLSLPGVSSQALVESALSHWSQVREQARHAHGLSVGDDTQETLLAGVRHRGEGLLAEAALDWLRAVGELGDVSYGLSQERPNRGRPPGK